MSIRVHRIRLMPNNKQRRYFAQSAGTARFAYNWALAKWIELYNSGLKPNEAALRRLLEKTRKISLDV